MRCFLKGVMVFTLSALAPSSELWSFVEIHWFDTGPIQPADSPTGHPGPSKHCLSLGSGLKTGEGISVGRLPLPGPLAWSPPIPWQPAPHPHLGSPHWSRELPRNLIPISLNLPPAPLCLQAFPTLQGWGLLCPPAKPPTPFQSDNAELLGLLTFRKGNPFKSPAF